MALRAMAGGAARRYGRRSENSRTPRAGCTGASKRFSEQPVVCHARTPRQTRDGSEETNVVCCRYTAFTTLTCRAGMRHAAAAAAKQKRRQDTADADGAGRQPLRRAHAVSALPPPARAQGLRPGLK
jgi:hypothetical protein